MNHGRRPATAGLAALMLWAALGSEARADEPRRTMPEEPLSWTQSAKSSALQKQEFGVPRIQGERATSYIRRVRGVSVFQGLGRGQFEFNDLLNILGAQFVTRLGLEGREAREVRSRGDEHDGRARAARQLTSPYRLDLPAHRMGSLGAAGLTLGLALAAEARLCAAFSRFRERPLANALVIAALGYFMQQSSRDKGPSG